MAKQQTPQNQNTSSTDTRLPIKGMTKDLNSALVGKENWTHAINAINNSKDGDVGTLGNEPANKLCSSAPYTLIGTIHLYGDKWVLFSTNNEKSEIGTWDDSQCEYKSIVNDYTCYECQDVDGLATTQFVPCLNFDTQHLITGASKENFDCSWQVYWDDGKNPTRTLNLDNIPYIKIEVSDPGAECLIYENTPCVDCEKLRLSPLVDIPCIKLSKSPDGGQLRNGSYQAFIAYTINDQIVGDYYGMSNIQPLFDHEDLLSGLEIEISNLDKDFEYFQLVILSNNQGEMQAKELGMYSTEQSTISVDYINQALKAIPLNILPLSNPVFEKSDNMYVVNDYLIRQGPTERYDFNYQPIANKIHTHYTVTQFDSDYYKKGGNKPTFMRDEVYSFFIRFVYETGDKSRSYHIPGRPPSWNGWQAPDGSIIGELDELTGDVNNLGAQASANGLCDYEIIDRAFEIYNTAQNQANQFWNNPQTLNSTITEDCGTVVAEGHMAYWESTERYPQDPVRWNSYEAGDGDDDPRFNLCGKPIRHHKFPDETFTGFGNPGGTFTDRSSNNGHTINVLGVKFENIKLPRYSVHSNEICNPNDGTPTGAVIPGIVGYEILVGSREGNKSIIAKGISRHMKRYNIPANAQGTIDSTTTVGMFPNYPFNSSQADPFLQGTNAFTFNYQAPNNIENPLTLTGYAGGVAGLSMNTYTFHSPDTSFNKPFLSPFEIKSYGMTLGTSIGRFRPSENHPQHKLLRNLAMWVGIIVGIGYAIGETRGKRSKKIDKPKGLSLGFQQEQISGGDGTSTQSSTGGTSSAGPGVGFGSGGIANTNVNFNEVDGGGASAPVGNNPGLDNAPPLLNVNAQFHGGVGTPYGADNSPIPGNAAAVLGGASGMNTPLGREMTLSGSAVLGGPKLGSYAYDASTYNAMSGYTSVANNTNRGYVGAGETIEFEGKRFTEAPSLVQVLFGIFNFMQLVAEGGQHIIDMIYELVSLQDYAWKYSGHGFYVNTTGHRAGEISRLLVDKARYIGPSIQNLTANIKINNLQRPSTVAIAATAPDPTGLLGFRFATGAEDNSRFCIGNFNGHFNPSQWRVANIGAHYTALKVNFRNQYGQLDQIKQIPAGCVYYFDQENIERDWQTGEYKWDLKDPDLDLGTVDFQTQIVYGGDCYINRYTEKVIMPFFWDFLDGQPDMFPFDYRLRSNVPRPIYWMNTAKYDLSELVRYIMNFTFLQGNQNNLNAISPNNLHFLDRSGNDTGQDQISGAGGAGAAGGPNNPGLPIQADGITTDRGGRSLFHIKNGYMYTHINGTQDFFVESSLNMGLRDYEDTDEKRHYDFADYTDLEQMYHSSIIRKDNFYKYDSSLSKSRFNTQLISFGQIQDRDYDPFVAEKCYTHFPKRLIYSLQAQKEAKKDFWRVFLPYNYKDFKNKVNVIKPVSKSGAFVTFPNLAPALFQGVDQLETDLGTKLTIGDGGLFSQPMQNVVNADEAHEYGSCESQRSVINTPSGLYYMSQAQGKVFHYGGKGLENIANAGMKQWFNKYLPSVLLEQYPGMEDCQGWIDNPVAGVGCQTVYDPNYDIIYFCKKDYKALDTECIEFDPCNGFVFNQTKCNNLEPNVCCPDGYTFVPGSNQPTCPNGYTNVSCLDGSPCCTDNSGMPPIPATINIGDCQKNVISEALVEGGYAGCIIDIAIVLDMSGSNFTTQGHVTGDAFTTQFVQAIDASMDGSATGLANAFNTIQVGLATYTDGIVPGACACNNPGPGSNAIVSDMTTNSSGLNALTTGNGANTAFGGQPVNGGDGYDSALWQGMQILNNTAASDLGDRSGQAGYRQIMVVLTDAGSGNACTNANCFGCPNAPNINTDIWNQGIETYIVQCTQADNANINIPAGDPTAAVVQCMVDPAAGGLANAFRAGPTQGGEVADIIANAVCGEPPVYYCEPDCNPGLVTNAAGEPECHCFESVPPTLYDTTLPISIHDETYFEEVSWTVSYDPKAKAWISFHDWHPDLTIPSLNHFFTTKDIVVDDDQPQCPPGYMWNPVTMTCCQQFTAEYPADILVEYEDIVVEMTTINCLLDIVIAVDTSGSTGGFIGAFDGFVNTFVSVFAPDMTAGNVQIGLVDWDTNARNVTPDMNGNTGNGVSMSHYVTSTNWGTDYLGAAGGSTNFYAAFDFGQNMLSDVNASTLGDRTSEPGYKRVFIQLADGDSNDTPQAASYYAALQGNMPSDFPQTDLGIGYANAAETAGQLSIPSETYGIYCHPTGTADQDDFDNITDNNAAFQFLDLRPTDVGDFARELASNICSRPSCPCPDGYVRITTPIGPNPPGGYQILTLDEACSGGEGDRNPKNGICRKITCDCDEDNLPSTYVSGTLQALGDCPGDLPNGIAEYFDEDYLWNGVYIGNPDFVILNPRSCQYDYLCCIDATYERGGIWKHNDRCDLYTNYYDQDYPWEVELVETVGQTVNTVRSVEYQLESYIYRGNLEGGCGDRFHDLDWNFDNAILHNTEQVSGLLALNLSPKNNAPLITTFPQITANDIQILYSKEEQKYRFNQFWDVTDDRGEFNPNVNEPIFITQLNGYIRDLNQNNINLAKPSFQRKKFRHYWNAVILRKNISGNRKMLLKLNNSKLNVSFR
jgi:hypothetical protein